MIFEKSFPIALLVSTVSSFDFAIASTRLEYSLTSF